MSRLVLIVACTVALSGCNLPKHTQAEVEAAQKAEQRRAQLSFCDGVFIGRMTVREFKDCERILKESPHD